MSQEDLFKVWAEEAKAALGAKKKGTVVDLWKVVAERKVKIAGFSVGGSGRGEHRAPLMHGLAA